MSTILIKNIKINCPILCRQLFPEMAADDAYHIVTYSMVFLIKILFSVVLKIYYKSNW